MKFAICLSELAGYTSYTGGVGRRYAATIPELAALGHEITVVLVADSPLLPDPLEIPGVKVLTHAGLVGVPWRLRTVPRALLFRLLLSRIGATHVYSPEWLGSSAFAPRRVRLVTNLVASLGLITEFAGRDAVARKSSVKSWLDRLQVWTEDRQIKRSSAVIACSDAILRWNQRRFSDQLPSGVVVPNCINVDRVRDLARSAELPLGWPQEDGPVVLFAGRVQLIKGIDVALSAFEELGSTYGDVKFVIAGGEGDTSIDPSLSDLKAQLSPTIKARTVFLGQVDERALYGCMREATVVVCPSRWEAFGNIALEVRASGGVLIATSGSGFAESCESFVDSLLVEPDNSAALVKALSQVLTDSEFRESLRRGGIARVEGFRASHTASRLSCELERIWA